MPSDFSLWSQTKFLPQESYCFAAVALTMNDDDAVAHSSLAAQLHADLVQSLASNKVADVYNILTLLESLKTKSHPTFAYFHDESAAIAVLSEARELLKRWRSDLKEGDYIDKFSQVDAVCCGARIPSLIIRPDCLHLLNALEYTFFLIILQGWYNAKVLSRTGNEIRVHYLNWAEKFDSDICIDDVTLIPYTARTKEHRSTKMKKLSVLLPSSLTGEAVDNTSNEGDTGETTEDFSMTTVDESPGARARLAAAEKNELKEKQRNKIKEREIEGESLTRGSRSSRASLLSSQAVRENVPIKQESNGSNSIDILSGGVEEGDSDIGTDITGEGKTISTISSNGNATKLESELENQQVEKIPKLLNGREYGAGMLLIVHCGTLC